MSLIKSISWSFFEQIFTQGILIAFNVFFTRQLTANDIGFWAILITINSASNIILDAGFSAAIIQADKASNQQFKTVFVLNLTCSLILYLLCFSIAPYITSSLKIHDYVYTSYLRLYSIGILLNALISVPKIILMRRLEFKKLAVINIISGICSVLVGVILLINGAKFYALIFQFLISLLIQFIFYIIDNCEFLKEKFSISSIQELFKYGKRLFLSSVLDNGYQATYNFIIAKNYSISSLGYFNRAKYLHDIPNNAFGLIFIRVLFPHYSRIHNEKGLLIELHKRLLILILLLILPLVLISSIFSNEIVFVLFGSDYNASSLILPILILNIPFYIVDSLNLTLLKSIGRSDLFLKVEVQKKLTAILLIIAAIFVKNLYFLYIIFPLGGFVSVLLGMFSLNYVYNEKTFFKKTVIVFSLSLMISAISFIILHFFYLGVLSKTILCLVVISIFTFFYSKLFNEIKSYKRILNLFNEIIK